MKSTKKQKVEEINDIDEISRRDAMKKMGLTAFSVATMLLLLNKPENAIAGSIDDPIDPGDPIDW